MPAGTISTVLLAPVVAALPEASRAAFFRATDTTPDAVRDPEQRVSAAQFCVAWSELVRWTGDPTIALRIAEATPVGAFGVVEYLCRCQPTLGDALRAWVRYLNILDDAVVVGLVEEGDAAAVRVLVESEAPAPASHELCFALLVRQAKEITSGDASPIAVELTHEARVDPARYARWFGAPVRFGSAETQLLFPRAALDAPLRTADAGLTAVFEGLVAEREATLHEVPSFVADVRREVQFALRNGDAGADGVAGRLGLTSRSLQRRLKAEGTTLSELKRDVQQELAGRYLDEGLSTAEISFLLGFSEPSAFFRAFKRWTGITPIERRAQAT
ncbi:MAG: AraC family transcriptional regulator [Sandaracinaceae bacterium]|nr:AraC family transcriptional regulator [Sandaracinaceae bacterium]